MGKTKLAQTKKSLHTVQDTTDWDGEKSQRIVGRHSKKKDLPFHIMNTVCLLKDIHSLTLMMEEYHNTWHHITKDIVFILVSTKISNLTFHRIFSVIRAHN